MGNCFNLLLSIFWHDDLRTPIIDPEELNYALFDPNQLHKPVGRTKDLIAYKNIHYPHQLDRTVELGCDTLWKCFKRTAWRYPNNPFLGVRKKITGFGGSKMGATYGEYQWQTFK